MLAETDRQEIQKQMKVAMFIWLAMLGSLVVYLLIARILGPEFPGRLNPNPVHNKLLIPLISVGAVSLVLAGVMRKQLFKFSDAPTGSSLDNEQIRAVCGKYIQAVIVSLAIVESVGIYGLVLYLLGARESIFYMFLGASAAGMLYYRPSLSEIEERLENRADF